MRNALVYLGLLAASAVLSACGGGSGTTSSSTGTTTTAGTGGTGGGTTTSTTTAVPPTSTTAKPLVSPTTSFLAYTGNTELVPFALGLLVLGGALRMLAKRSK